MVMERKNAQSPPGTSEENIQQEDNEEQDEDEEDEEEGFHCAGCQSCSFECETIVDTQDELSESCEYDPSLEDAFSKFGHNVAVLEMDALMQTRGRRRWWCL